MPIDWEKVAGAPNVAVFGEPATYIPVTGAPYAVNGVFDDQFRATVIIDADAKSTDTLPVFGVNRAQFQAEPQQNDRLSFPAGTKPYSGKSYIVVEPRPDNHGIYHLALNETANA